MMGERVPGPDYDALLTAPAQEQTWFLAWRCGVFG